MMKKSIFCAGDESLSETRAMILILRLHADLPTTSLALTTSVALLSIRE